MCFMFDYDNTQSPRYDNKYDNTAYVNYAMYYNTELLYIY